MVLVARVFVLVLVSVSVSVLALVLLALVLVLALVLLLLGVLVFAVVNADRHHVASSRAATYGPLFGGGGRAIGWQRPAPTQRKGVSRVFFLDRRGAHDHVFYARLPATRRPTPRPVLPLAATVPTTRLNATATTSPTTRCTPRRNAATTTQTDLGGTARPSPLKGRPAMSRASLATPLPSGEASRDAWARKSSLVESVRTPQMA